MVVYLERKEDVKGEGEGEKGGVIFSRKEGRRESGTKGKNVGTSQN